MEPDKVRAACPLFFNEDRDRTRTPGVVSEPAESTLIHQPTDYSAMLVRELTPLLKARGLDPKGRKAGLIGRLRSDDTQKQHSLIFLQVNRPPQALVGSWWVNKIISIRELRAIDPKTPTPRGFAAKSIATSTRRIGPGKPALENVHWSCFHFSSSRTTTNSNEVKDQLDDNRCGICETCVGDKGSWYGGHFVLLEDFQDHDLTLSGFCPESTNLRVNMEELYGSNNSEVMVFEQRHPNTYTNGLAVDGIPKEKCKDGSCTAFDSSSTQPDSGYSLGGCHVGMVEGT